MKKLAAKVLCGLFAITATAGFSMVAEAAHGDKVNIAAPFKATVLVDGLGSPWEVLWGPDNSLWVTERQAKSISKVDPKKGKHKVLYTFNNAVAAPPHQGVLGLALDPQFLKGNNYVYTAYTYEVNGEKHARIVRMTYDPKTETLRDETAILDNLPASVDHNSGRLRFGPDGKLYYTIGDQGNNQGTRVAKEIQAQMLPTAEQVAANDYSLYPGKILRLNADGSIPSDNPVLNGVQSHVYAYGFRNTQGLAFVGDKLFATEHGPSTDDELNLIEKAATMAGRMWQVIEIMNPMCMPTIPRLPKNCRQNLIQTIFRQAFRLSWKQTLMLRTLKIRLNPLTLFAMAMILPMKPMHHFTM